MHLVRTILVLLAVLITVTLAGVAQAQRDALQDWILLSGQASEVAIATDGTVYAVAPDGSAWRLPPKEQAAWSPLPGTLAHISAGDFAWAVFTDGTAAFLRNGIWVPLPGISGLLDIGGGRGETAWLVDSQGRIARYMHNKPLSSPKSVAAVKIAVAPDQTPWFINEKGFVKRLPPSGPPKEVPCRASDLDIGPQGETFFVSNGSLMRWDADSAACVNVNSPAAKTVAVGPGGHPWVSTPSGEIVASRRLDTSTATTTRDIGRDTITAGSFNWRTISGNVQDFGISPSGTVFAVAPDNSVWRWGNGVFKGWTSFTGRLSRIAVAPDDTPWGVTATGGLAFHNGRTWKQLPIPLKGQAEDIAIGSDATVWAAIDGIPMKLSRKQKGFTPRDVGVRVKRLAVAAGDALWLVAQDGGLHYNDGTTTQDMKVKARDVGVGPDKAVFIISETGAVARYDRHDKHFALITDRFDAVSMAVGPGGKPWIALSDGTAVASAMFDNTRPPQAGPDDGTIVSAQSQYPADDTPPGEITTSGPLNFSKVNGKVISLGVGPKGHIFAASSTGDLLRFSDDTRRFKPFPFDGKVARTTSDPDGNPWVITVTGEVYRYNGATWRSVRGLKTGAREVAVGLDGTVAILDEKEDLYRYDARKNVLLPMQATGIRLAVAPNGDIWTVSTDNAISRCATLPCQRLPGNGTDIGIGPDGSVFVVNERGQLMRWEEVYTGQGLQGSWKRVDTPRFTPQIVSVGPKGLPWVATQQGEVWAAGFFGVDEATSRQTAMGASSITFSKSYRAKYLGWYSYPSVGPDGEVYLLVYPGQEVAWWKPDTKTLEESTKSVNPGTLAAGEGDTYWYESGGIVYEVPDRDKSAKAYDRSKGFVSAGNALDLDVGPGSVVFAISSDNKLYRYTPHEDQFELFDNQLCLKVASDPNGSPWIITSTSYVKYWDGDSFEDPGRSKQKATDIGIGPGGTVFIIDTTANKTLYRFNATNRNFDQVTIKNSDVTTNRVSLDVDADGWPWVHYIFGPDDQVIRPNE